MRLAEVAQVRGLALVAPLGLHLPSGSLILLFL